MLVLGDVLSRCERDALVISKKQTALTCGIEAYGSLVVVASAVGMSASSQTISSRDMEFYGVSTVAVAFKNCCVVAYCFVVSFEPAEAEGTIGEGS